MNFMEVVKALKEGKSVRLGKCKCGYHLDDREQMVADNQNNHFYLSIGAALSEDWQIVEE